MSEVKTFVSGQFFFLQFHHLSVIIILSNINIKIYNP